MARLARLADSRLLIPVRLLGLTALAFVAVGIFLLLFGKNPLAAYRAIFAGAFGSTYGLSEVVVRAIPLMLCAAATAIPARIGLLNVGGEGQLHAGAMAATWGALTLGFLPRAALLPGLVALGLLGGAAAALVPAVLRWAAGVNETISTLLLNYVIVLLVEYVVRGPWKDPLSYNWPFTPEFSDSARLGLYWGTRIHAGLWFALVAIALFYFVLRRTRWGYEVRVIGDNPEAAVRAGIPLGRYILLTMCAGGALAGLAGMAEVCAIQSRLRPGISTGFGYTGFLVSWLALHHPLGIVAMAVLLGVLSVGGDQVQISLGLPYATVNIIMALIFFVVLGSRFRAARTA
ncbi:MAG: ABC transporter permease [Candidatus Rokubacteria bacterium]|nr:ABC transporter permease [Candidatus Rokubacteria bacterium]